MFFGTFEQTTEDENTEGECTHEGRGVSPKMVRGHS